MIKNSKNNKGSIYKMKRIERLKKQIKNRDYINHAIECLATDVVTNLHLIPDEVIEEENK